MIKFPGAGAAASGVLGEAGGAAASLMKGGIGAQTIGTVLHSPNGGASQAKQENSDLSKVVEDLLHDKLMDKMGGAGGPGGAASPFGGAASPLGGLHLPRMEGGHGPVVHQGGLGGLQGLGGQSPLQGAQKENGDLKNLLGDLLKQRTGGSQGAAQPQQQSPLQGENDDLKKLLGDLLKSLTGGQGAQQAQPQQSALQGENQDLMKLLSDLLKGGGAQGAGDSDQASDPASMLENVLKQNKQMKSVLGAMQQQQSPDQLSGALQMTQQMMTQGA